VYEDVDGGDPRNKIVTTGDGNDLRLIETREVLIPGGAYLATLDFDPPLCLDGVAGNIEIVMDCPDLYTAGATPSIPDQAGYGLRPSGGAVTGQNSGTFLRLSCADAAGAYVLAETVGATFTAQWVVSFNGDFSNCNGFLDCNGDGVTDLIQIRQGRLADFNANLIPDCCESSENCVVGHFPVQWRINDGGNGHWYQLRLTPPGVSWGVAQAEADVIGGHLATLTSTAENGFVVAALKGSVTRYPWIGLRQSAGAPEPTGGWEWVTGEGLNYTNWSPSEPNGDGVFDADQANIWLVDEPGRPLGTWNDWHTGGPDGYILEWSADCNNDGIVDYGQILTGQLADSDANGVPDICERPTDINRDGVVNGGDLALLLDNWGGTGTGDVDGDGTVGGGDLTLVLNDWG
jgi:hypothetical protein